MVIKGLQKTTLLDYPGHVAATIFTGGCNFRCPFCHNASLVLSPNLQDSIPETDVFSFLEKRKNVLSGICITGGEPTLQNDLIAFIEKVKSFGYAVKLDTNGTNPSLLQYFLSNELIDYCAMDVKSSLSSYQLASGIKDLDTNPIIASINLLKSSSIDYEFRTTIVKGLHALSNLKELATLLGADVSAYYLQPFQKSADLISYDYDEFSEEELQAILLEIKKIIPHTILRGSS